MGTQNKNGQNNSRQKQYGNKLKHEFNRVVSHPDYFLGAPFVKDANVPVDDIIDLWEQGHKDRAIRAIYPQLSQQDMHACRAYQVRFRPETLKATHNLDPNDKHFLVDENTSYFLLYDIAKIFGWSSHVTAEGMQGYGPTHDDEKHIWAHAVAKGYKAILTADSDFTDISERHRKEAIRKHGSVKSSPVHTPAVIRMEKNLSNIEVLGLLARHQDDIRDFISQNAYTHAFIDKSGFSFGISDNSLKKSLKISNDNKPSAPSGSP